MDTGVHKESCIKYSSYMGRVGDVIEDVKIHCAVSIPVTILGDIACFLIEH